MTASSNLSHLSDRPPCLPQDQVPAQREHHLQPQSHGLLRHARERHLHAGHVGGVGGGRVHDHQFVHGCKSASWNLWRTQLNRIDQKKYTKIREAGFDQIVADGKRFSSVAVGIVTVSSFLPGCSSLSPVKEVNLMLGTMSLTSLVAWASRRVSVTWATHSVTNLSLQLNGQKKFFRHCAT